MQRPFRIAAIADAASVSGTVFLLIFLWFRLRGLGAALSVLLSAAVCSLMLYAYFLHKKQLIKSKQRISNKQRAMYALTMLPHEIALQHAAEALSEKYRLILLPQTTADVYRIAYEKSGRKLAVALYAEPSAPDIKFIHEIHKSRGSIPMALICTALPEAAADQYASSLTPPFRLIAADTLPFDKSLADAYPHKGNPKKKRTAFTLLKAGSKRAVRCMLFSFGLMVYYLLTGQRPLLLPSLVLAFFAVLSKAFKEEQTLF